MPYYRYKNDIEKTGREYFKCLDKIDHIHKRLKKLFDDLPKEEYLKSGIKKESYITNAQSHAENNHFFLIDITKFFPSITKTYIKKELILTYKQSSNVAEFISNALTAPQKKIQERRALVTGSPLSQYFAYVINKKMFDQLSILAKKEDIKFSVYVDDLSFSSNKPIGHKFLNKVFGVIKSNGFDISKNKPDKKKFYRGKIGNNSLITGVVVTEDGLFIPKQREEKIRNNLKKLSKITPQNSDFDKLYISVRSSIHQAIIVNTKYKDYLIELECIKNSTNKY